MATGPVGEDSSTLHAVEGLKRLVLESRDENRRHIDTKFDALRDWLREHNLSHAPSGCCDHACSARVGLNIFKGQEEQKDEPQADGNPTASSRKCTECGNGLMPDAMFCPLSPLKKEHTACGHTHARA